MWQLDFCVETGEILFDAVPVLYVVKIVASFYNV